MYNATLLRQIDHALRRTIPEPPPALRLIRQREDRLELQFLQDQPVDPSPPARRLRRNAWSVPLGRGPDPGDPAAPYPGLAKIGTEADGSVIFIDLAGHPTLVHGRSRCPVACLKALALDLVGSPWADGLTVEMIGFGDRLAETVPARAIEYRHLEEFAEGRSRPGLRVVLSAEVDRPRQRRLLKLLLGGEDLGAVTIALDPNVPVPDDHWRLDLDENTATIAGLAWRLELVSVTEAEYYRRVAHFETHRPSGRGAGVGRDDGLRLNILGVPEIQGTAQDLKESARRAQCLELAVFLAVNPGATTRQIRDGLAEGRSPRSLYPLLSKLRQWLGKDADGGEHLPWAKAGRYPLGPHVRLDWHEFLTLTRQAGSSPEPEATVLRDRALGLVYGPPLGDQSGRYGWAVELREQITSAILRTANRAAKAHLDAGDLDAARAAADTAILVVPAYPVAWRALLTIADHAQDGADVRRTYRRYQQACARSGTGNDVKTVELAEAMLRKYKSVA